MPWASGERSTNFAAIPVTLPSARDGAGLGWGQREPKGLKTSRGGEGVAGSGGGGLGLSCSPGVCARPREEWGAAAPSPPAAAPWVLQTPAGQDWAVKERMEKFGGSSLSHGTKLGPRVADPAEIHALKVPAVTENCRGRTRRGLGGELGQPHCAHRRGHVHLCVSSRSCCAAVGAGSRSLPCGHRDAERRLRAAGSLRVAFGPQAWLGPSAAECILLFPPPASPAACCASWLSSWCCFVPSDPG